MSRQVAKASDSEQERKQLIDELVAEYGPNWSEEFKPGSFGCHELLDRTLLLRDTPTITWAPCTATHCPR